MVYHVYPRAFSDLIAQFMKKNVPGYADLQAADDRWKDYFNELRKRVRKQRLVSLVKHQKNTTMYSFVFRFAGLLEEASAEGRHGGQPGLP